MISIARIASSLPGIGRSIKSGSLSVSIRAMVVTPSLRASLTAMCSRRVSMMNITPGMLFHLADAFEVGLDLDHLPLQGAFIFLE